jgi:D-arabinose 5-phosphate isomerase GutQ
MEQKSFEIEIVSVFSKPGTLSRLVQHSELHLNLPSPSHNTPTTAPTVETTLTAVVAELNLPEPLHHQSSEFGTIIYTTTHQNTGTANPEATIQTTLFKT